MIRCNVAKQLPQIDKGKAVWNSEDWIKDYMKEEEKGVNEGEGEGGYASDA